MAMDPLERLSNLIETVMLPQLNRVADKVDQTSADIQGMKISHERHSGKLETLEGRFHALKCDENTNIMRGHGSRIAKIEAHIEEGHKQNAQCVEKNLKVDEALRLAKANKQKNEEQEARYRKIIGFISAIFVIVIGGLLLAYFQKHLIT